MSENLTLDNLMEAFKPYLEELSKECPDFDLEKNLLEEIRRNAEFIVSTHEKLIEWIRQSKLPEVEEAALDFERTQGQYQVILDVVETARQEVKNGDIGEALSLAALAGVMYEGTQPKYLEQLNAALEKAQQAKEKRMVALTARNSFKANAKSRAEDIADSLWTDDLEEKIRISGMANKVWSCLVDEGFTDMLPENVESLKSWIREVAPPYALKGGRPKTR
jgi:hypothetical protein